MSMLLRDVAVLAGRELESATERQRKTSLAKANEVRHERAWLKRELRAGRARLEELLHAPCFARAQVLEVLMAIPNYGRVRASRLLYATAIMPTRPVGELTERQRQLLIDATAHLCGRHCEPQGDPDAPMFAQPEMEPVVKERPRRMRRARASA